MLCVVMVVCFDAVSAAITPKIVFYWLGVMISLLITLCGVHYGIAHRWHVYRLQEHQKKYYCILEILCIFTHGKLKPLLASCVYAIY